MRIAVGIISILLLCFPLTSGCEFPFFEEPEEYILDVDIQGEGAVNIDPPEDEFSEGTEVTLTAVPEDGWTFQQWQGDLEGTNPEKEIVIDEEKEITAVFKENDYAGLEDGATRIYNIDASFDFGEEQEEFSFTRTETIEKISQENNMDIFAITIEVSEQGAELWQNTYKLGRDGDKYYNLIPEENNNNEYIEELYLEAPIKEDDPFLPIYEFIEVLLLLSYFEEASDPKEQAQELDNDELFDPLMAIEQGEIDVPAGIFEDAWLFTPAFPEEGETVNVWFIPHMGSGQIYFVIEPEENEEFETFKLTIELEDFDY